MQRQEDPGDGMYYSRFAILFFPTKQQLLHIMVSFLCHSLVSLSSKLILRTSAIPLELLVRRRSVVTVNRCDALARVRAAHFFHQGWRLAVDEAENNGVKRVRGNVHPEQVFDLVDVVFCHLHRSSLGQTASSAHRKSRHHTAPCAWDPSLSLGAWSACCTRSTCGGNRPRWRPPAEP